MSPWIALFAAGLAVALAVRLLARPLLAGASPGVAPDTGPQLPVLLRIGMQRAQFLSGALQAALPGRLGHALDRQLARSGLAQHADAATWAALLLLAALAAAFPLALCVVAGMMASPWLIACVLPPLLAQQWLAGAAARGTARVWREMPAMLDVLVLCLEAGASLGSAMKIAAEKSADGPLRVLLMSVLGRVRAGRSRVAALREVLAPLELECTTALMTALVQSELTGMSLGPALRAQSAQAMTDRFLRAERAAMQAPVKLLLPLLAFIFPCTFIIIGVPIAARLVGMDSP